MNDITILTAFVAGLASFLSPCVLPLVPVYFASLAGPEIMDCNKAISRMPIFLHSLCFVLGFTVVFTVVGTLVGLAGIIINPSSIIIRIISGSLLLILGLFMLAALKIPYEKRLALSLGRISGYLRSFLVGGVFAMAWTPCIGPVLGAILTLAMNSETVFQGGFLLTIYSLGLGIPFLITGLAFSSITPLLKRLNRYSGWVYVISGILLIIVGILILTNNLQWLYV
jgi:cytochrome c-type biogenesis protein